MHRDACARKCPSRTLPSPGRLQAPVHEHAPGIIGDGPGAPPDLGTDAELLVALLHDAVSGTPPRRYSRVVRRACRIHRVGTMVMSIVWAAQFLCSIEDHRLYTYHLIWITEITARPGQRVL